jgi:hypothetical protein
VRAGLLQILCSLALTVLPDVREAQAGVLQACDPPAERSAAQQDRLLRMSALVRERMEASGSQVAILARSGLNLSWWGQRYSHAGLSLQANPAGAWFVRQLYYDCTERQPRIFDEGLAGFINGMADPDRGALLVLLLPSGPGVTERIATLALHAPTAVGLVGARYSANAHAFSTWSQNCNQWLAELLALAVAGQPAIEPHTGLREAAQALLRAQGYEPTTLSLGHPLVTWVAGRIPWLSLDDHPPEDLQRQQLRLSLPESIASHLRRHVPGMRQIEVCLNQGQVVVRENGPALDAHCAPQSGDEVIALD